nr:MAG TPA: hypothetical protein [Caudoviricetes sp.]
MTIWFGAVRVWRGRPSYKVSFHNSLRCPLLEDKWLREIA